MYIPGMTDPCIRNCIVAVNAQSGVCDEQIQKAKCFVTSQKMVKLSIC